MLAQADALQIPLANGIAQCIISSPPYWGLRTYLAADSPLKAKELGAEALHDCRGWATGRDCGECYVCHMRAVAKECWRVLRDDGTMWLNLGSTYVSASIPGLKPKDDAGIPWRVVLALQADGWYLRSEIIWAKPSPMPESVTDRPTKAHEQVFLLTKSARYFYDNDAIREPHAESWRGKGEKEAPDEYQTTDRDAVEGRQFSRRGVAIRQYNPAGRNRHSVWSIATAPFSGAHFATFPPALVEPMILAGTKPGDLVLDPFCGSGTVGKVAALHGRRFIGLDLSHKYLTEIALARSDGKTLERHIKELPLFSIGTP